METMNKIQAKYLAQHDALGTLKDAPDKALFKQQHSQIWGNCNTELKARLAELKAKPSLSASQQIELTNLKSLFYEPPMPARDLVSEIDELKAEIAKLKGGS